MVLVRIWPFFQLFFLDNIVQENVFYDILERKNAFLGYKNKNYKQSENSHFSKGVNTWFWSKNGRLSNFFFQAIKARKMSFMIFQHEKTPFQAIQTRRPKSPKIDIFNPWFWSKNGHFSNSFFFLNIGQENIFYNSLEPKYAFLGHKIKTSKKSKN